jgi:imidazolonepropionase-like amidohydrolase
MSVSTTSRVSSDSGTHDRWLLLSVGTLIDGTGARALKDAAVLVHGDRIVEVGPAGSVKAPSAAHVERLDLSDSTLIPGLVDSHFHVGYFGHLGLQELEYPASLEFAAVCAGQNARVVLEAGCTSVLDVGCRGNIAVAVQKAVSTGVLVGPRSRVSGQIICTRGGPLDFWPSAITIEPRTRLFAFVSGVEEIRAEVRQQWKAGVDNVKLQITASTVQLGRGGAPTTFTPEELACAVQTAHDCGLSVAAHAEGPASVQAAIHAGFDTIQHASFLDDPTIDALEKNPQTRVVFTLGVYDSIIRDGLQSGYDPDVVTKVADSWPRMLDAVRLAYKRGVPFTAGSDGGGRIHPHGRLAREAVILVRECGVSVEDAVRALTLHSAEAAWLQETGSVQPGRLADLVAVRGDLRTRIETLEDIENIALVVQGGNLIVGEPSKSMVGAAT